MTEDMCCPISIIFIVCLQLLFSLKIIDTNV